MQETILQSVGETPLVQLRRVTEGLTASVYVKLEHLNPGGSVKDRVGVAMIAEAERRGWLRPGGTIIEATAGNTGVGLAMAAAVKGYRSIFVLPDKMSAEKVRLLKAYGAEVVITPTNVAPDSPESYNGVADRLKFFNLRAKNAAELKWDGPLVSLTTVRDFSSVLGPDARD